MYKKALHSEDKDTAQRVIQTSEPEKLKKISKSVHGFQKSEWHRVATDIYVSGSSFEVFTE